MKTTITTYNSVDKSYFDKATNVFNEQYKISEQTNEDLNSLDDDELDEELERLLKEKEERRRKRNTGHTLINFVKQNK